MTRLRDFSRGRAALGLTASMLATLLLVIACTPSVPPAATPTQAPVPPSTPRPAPTATPLPAAAVDPIAAIVARQTELRTFRQAVKLEVGGSAEAAALVANVMAEGEAARPNTRLDVRTDALGTSLGFQFVQAEGRMYVNPYGLWLAFDGQAIPEGLPLVPIPLGANPDTLLPLLANSQVTPAVGVPVRGESTDVLRLVVPPERAGQLAEALALPRSLAFLQGQVSYTDASAELAVGRADGFMRRVALVLRGYVNGDATRTFVVQSTTELWDVNDPSIVVNPPDAPTLKLPSLDQLPLPFR
jgi:hypothetical protein